MEQLEQIRVQKLKQIRELGYDPYPNTYRYTHTIGQVVRDFAEKTAEQLEHGKHKVRVAGRILANRPFGKAGFMALSDGQDQVQVYAKKDQLPERDRKSVVEGKRGGNGGRRVEREERDEPE